MNCECENYKPKQPEPKFKVGDKVWWSGKTVFHFVWWSEKAVINFVPISEPHEVCIRYKPAYDSGFEHWHYLIENYNIDEDQLSPLPKHNSYGLDFKSEVEEFDKKQQKKEPSVDAINIIPNYYVTKHFHYTKFKCPCCDMLKLTPGFYEHVALLERMREKAGFDIIILSGYMCQIQNHRWGDYPDSWHRLFATDIQADDSSPDKLMRLWELAKELKFGGIMLHEYYLHLDLRPDRVWSRG